MLTSSRKAFTMIELIFVIVIIGILAAVAIPKLAATRDDAKVSKAMKNLTVCINDIGAQYTATGAADVTVPAACVATTDETCFTVAVDATGTMTVGTGASTEAWCTTGVSSAQTFATAQGLIGTHTFGGSKITR